MNSAILKEKTRHGPFQLGKTSNPIDQVISRKEIPTSSEIGIVVAESLLRKPLPRAAGPTDDRAPARYGLFQSTIHVTTLFPVPFL